MRLNIPIKGVFQEYTGFCGHCEFRFVGEDAQGKFLYHSCLHPSLSQERIIHPFHCGKMYRPELVAYSKYVNDNQPIQLQKIVTSPLWCPRRSRAAAKHPCLSCDKFNGTGCDGGFSSRCLGVTMSEFPVT